MKKRIILVIIACALLIIGLWVSSVSYIEVTVNSPAGNQITYNLLHQDNQKTTEVSTPQRTFKKMVRKGSYEVLVKQNSKSYFAVVKTGGFLKKTVVQARLLPEKGRKFVGNNPGPCMSYLGQILLSSGCGDVYSNLLLHIPASPTTPTYTQKSTSATTNSLEGVVKLREGDVAVLQAPGADEDLGPPHAAFILRPDLQLLNGKVLDDLASDKSYTVASYKDGFIAYDTGYSQAWYYPSLNTKPEPINLERPQDDKLAPYALNVHGESLVVAYADVSEELDFDAAISPKIKSEIVIQTAQTTKRFNFGWRFETVRLCGKNKLCALKDNRLEVYDVSSNKPRLLYAISDVERIENLKDKLLVIKGVGVLGLDVDTQTGSIHYSLGEYSYCGIHTQGANYTLCLTNPKQNKVALAFSSEDDTDSIDKKVAELLKLGEVRDVSIYGSYIFISPDLGDPIYIDAARGFDYDPGVKSTVDSKINQEIDRLKIDRAKYRIVNTLE